MPRLLPLTLATFSAIAFGAFSLPTAAQEIENQPVPAAIPVGNQIANVSDANFATLPALLGRRAAISLGVNEATLEAAPQIRDQLLDWTRNGGIVFLHNDAARLFGYQTTPARLGNNRQAGQLFGRAVNALPFGAHPLLQGAKTVIRPVDPTRLPGVNVVFYTMNEGDELVVSHPAGTPLLEVTDLAAAETIPLYAAAIAPFGRGYAVFTPDYIDQKRGDGATFAANLLTLLPTPVVANPQANPANAAPVDVNSVGPKFVGVSHAAITAGATALAADLRRALSFDPTSAPALPPIGVPDQASVVPNANSPQAVDVLGAPVGAVMPPVAPTSNMAAALQDPVLMLTRAEAVAVQAALQASPTLTLAILRTRVAILRNDIQAANTQLAILIQSAPDSAESAFLTGVLNAHLANNVAIPSANRSAAARTAANEFARSVTARPVIAIPASTATVTTGPLVAGVTAAQISIYATEMDRLSRLFSFDPPLVTSVGRGSEAIIVRFAPGDLDYATVLEAAQLISSSRLSGWRTHRQEILLFPNAQTYAAYRIAAGQTRQNVPSPAAMVGDVTGSRIIMAPNVVGAGGLTPYTLSFLSRLQAYSQLSAWYDGTGRIPVWLALGIENQVANTIGTPIEIINGQALEQFARVGGLLTPTQFDAQGGTPSSIASLQATSLVDYFYKVHGAGAVTETIQRLANGESPDSALEATTQLNQMEFFQAWRNAQFGPRNFPNAG
jgi:hypothetical protein